VQYAHGDGQPNERTLRRVPGWVPSVPKRMGRVPERVNAHQWKFSSLFATLRLTGKR